MVAGVYGVAFIYCAAVNALLNVVLSNVYTKHGTL